MIKKIGSKYVVLSETSGRRMGSYRTKKEAVKRLQQVEFFKHLKSSPSLRGKLKKKSLMNDRTASGAVSILEKYPAPSGVKVILAIWLFLDLPSALVFFVYVLGPEGAGLFFTSCHSSRPQAGGYSGK